MSLIFAIKTVNVSPSLCHKSRAEEVLELEKLLAVELKGAEALGLVNFGTAEPAIENSSLPWLRTDAAGRPLGWWVKYNGVWVKDYGCFSIGQPVAFRGAVSDIRVPFLFADGTEGTPDLRPYMISTESQQIAENIGTGDGSGKVFNLSHTPSEQDIILIMVDKTVERPTTDFTRVGKVVTFNSAPSNGKPITAQYRAVPDSASDSYTLGWMIFGGYP